MSAGLDLYIMLSGKFGKEAAQVMMILIDYIAEKEKNERKLISSNSNSSKELK